MKFGDLSHIAQGEWILRSEAVSEIYEMSHGWLLDKYFILSKGNFGKNKRLKNLVMGYENLFNGYQPIRTLQISLR